MSVARRIARFFGSYASITNQAVKTFDGRSESGSERKYQDDNPFVRKAD